MLVPTSRGYLALADDMIPIPFRSKDKDQVRQGWEGDSNGLQPDPESDRNRRRQRLGRAFAVVEKPRFLDNHHIEGQDSVTKRSEHREEAMLD